MSAFVDTNILVRHLTGDPPEQAARATKFLAKADELLLADLAVAEVVDVLESFHEVPRPKVAELVRAIIAFQSVVVLDSAMLRGLRGLPARLRRRLPGRTGRAFRDRGGRLLRQGDRPRHDHPPYRTRLTRRLPP